MTAAGALARRSRPDRVRAVWEYSAEGFRGCTNRRAAAVGTASQMRRQRAAARGERVFLRQAVPPLSSARKTRREYSAVTAAAAAAPSKTDQAGQPSNNAP